MSGEALGGLEGLFSVLALSSAYLTQKPATLTLLCSEPCKLLAGGEGLSGGAREATASPRERSLLKRHLRFHVCWWHLRGCLQLSWVDVDLLRKAAAFAGKALSGLPGGPAACPWYIPAAGRCEPAL